MICLLTDFGEKDGATASMKGVIKSVNIEAEILDISHNITPYSVEEGAFVLWRCFRYYPDGTIFVVIVDPGVGSSRRPILLQTDRYYFIAPDNGILTYIINSSPVWKANLLSNRDYQLHNVSSTFHGRDIFAPASAHLSLGVEVTSFGKEIHDPVKLPFNRAKKEGESIKGEIIFFDQYGNAYTNIEKEKFQRELYHKSYELSINNRKVMSRIALGESFSTVEVGEALLYWGSSDLLEIAMNQRNLREKYGLKYGDQITLN